MQDAYDVFTLQNSEGGFSTYYAFLGAKSKHPFDSQAQPLVDFIGL